MNKIKLHLNVVNEILTMAWQKEREKTGSHGGRTLTLHPLGQSLNHFHKTWLIINYIT